MRTLLIFMTLGLGTAALAARPLSVGPLPAGECADTEVVTNCPFALTDPNVRHLLLALDLAATPSNGVEVAFGRDADADGVLALDEISLAVGWDAGGWIVREGLATGSPELASWSASAVTDATNKNLRLSLDWSPARVRRIVATENGRPLVWTLPDPLPTWMHGAAWDTMRLAVRGVDAPGETVWAKAKVDGTTLVIR